MYSPHANRTAFVDRYHATVIPDRTSLTIGRTPPPVTSLLSLASFWREYFGADTHSLLPPPGSLRKRTSIFSGRTIVLLQRHYDCQEMSPCSSSRHPFHHIAGGGAVVRQSKAALLLPGARRSSVHWFGPRTHEPRKPMKKKECPKAWQINQEG